MFDLILFDLDGTLTDPKEGITKCVQYALEACGIVENDLDKLTPFIGPPLVDGFMNFYGFDREKALFAVEKYRERFRDIGIFENRVYDGVAEMLKTLKQAGKKIALATSKPHIFADRILERFELMQYFDVTVGAELDGTRNEKDAVIRAVLAQFPDAENIIMVGDRSYDIIGAHACGIPCVGVQFGYAEPGELKKNGADRLAADIKALTEILLEN